MTASEFRKAVKEARVIYGYIRLNSNPGSLKPIKLAKSEALELVNGMDGRIELWARKVVSAPGVLHIGY